MAVHLVWQGRLHLGSEPGVYGDATYVGLSAELLLTLRRFPETDFSSEFSQKVTHQVTVRLTSEDVKVFGRGHEIQVFSYEPAFTKEEPHRWVERRIHPPEEIRLGNDNRVSFTLSFSESVRNAYVGVRLRVNTAIHPDLYDDFVWTRLSAESDTFYALLGADCSERPQRDEGTLPQTGR